MAWRGASLLLHQSPPPLGLGMLFLLRCHKHGPRNNSVEKLISNWNWVFSSICFSLTIKFPSLPLPLPLPLSLSLPLSFTLSFSISDFIARSSHLLRRRNRNQNHKKPTKKKRIKNMPQNRFNWSPREWKREKDGEREMGEMEKPDDSNYQLCFVSCHNKFLHIIDGALYIW